jgi:hypothetical protein
MYYHVSSMDSMTYFTKISPFKLIWLFKDKTKDVKVIVTLLDTHSFFYNTYSLEAELWEGRTCSILQMRSVSNYVKNIVIAQNSFGALCNHTINLQEDQQWFQSSMFLLCFFF